MSVGTDHDTAAFAVQTIRRWWYAMGYAPYPRARGLNWRARPLVSHEVIVNLIAGTKTKSGLTVRAELDTNSYPKGVVVTGAG